MGPLEMVKPWSTRSVEGVYRFLGRVWRLFIEEQSQTEFEQRVTLEPQRAAEFLEKVQLSPAIGAAGTVRRSTQGPSRLHQESHRGPGRLAFQHGHFGPHGLHQRSDGVGDPARLRAAGFPDSPAPLCPALCGRIVVQAQRRSPAPPASLSYAPWPEFDPALLVEDTLDIPVQVNGKLRDVVTVPANACPADLEAAAKGSEKVKPFLQGKTVRKVMVLPRKLVNIVAA